MNDVMTLEETIESVIESRLPAKFAEYLQRRLKEADSLETSVSQLTVAIDEANCTMARLEVEKKAVERELAERSAIDVTASDLEKDRAQLEHRRELCEQSVQHSNQRVEDHKEMVGLIFRNIEVRKQMTTPVAVTGGDMSTGLHDHAGAQIYQRQPGWVDDHESTTVEKAT